MWKLRPLQICILLAVLEVGHCTCPEHCQCNIVRHLVSCRGAYLTDIPLELPDPSSLKQLDLRGNHIRTLESEGGLPYTSLELLDLSDNSLTSLGDLLHLSSLKYLYLHRNKLSHIASSTFVGLHSLVELDLGENQLERLEDEVFAGLAQLEELDLSGNSLQKIGDNALVGLGSLRVLSLEDNRLVSLPNLMHTPHLRSLSLSYNKLSTIPAFGFSTVRELRTLGLAGNVLEEVSDEAFHWNDDDVEVNTQVPQLEKLDLQNNRLSSVPVLHSLASLVEINLSQNPIRAVGAYAFKGTELVHLKTVYLNSMSELEVVREHAFSGVDSLRSVYMHSNHKLSHIEPDAFHACTRVAVIDFHANSLSSLSKNTFDWSAVKMLDLRYNRWNCNCNISWLPGVLHGIHDNSSLGLLDQIMCSEPERLARRRLADVPPDSFRCGDIVTTKEHQFEDGIMIAIFAGTSCILLLLGAVLIYKYRASMCLQSQPGVDVYSYFVYHNPNRLARHHKIPPRKLQAKPRDPNKRLRHVTWSSTETDLNRASEMPRESHALTQREPKAPATATNGDAHNV